ncbi:MAG: SHOCT domain-containing protein [Deltaproteobacteria bacterium]|nr:SHOCT domain-containing protein [Deltaproteobacteria bacterium]MBW2069942.1 SHOCT domain-containing protein [Deltaproteobacteria bacterium]
MWGCRYFPFFSWGGHFWPGNLFSILLWGMIILAIIYLIGKLAAALRPRRNRLENDRNDSLSILKIRYARGELSQEEYFRMKEILEQPY